jgi:hypothetical protein
MNRLREWIRASRERRREINRHPPHVRRLLRHYYQARKHTAHEYAIEYAVRLELWFSMARQPVESDWRYDVYMHDLRAATRHLADE